MNRLVTYDYSSSEGDEEEVVSAVKDHSPVAEKAPPPEEQNQLTGFAAEQGGREEVMAAAHSSGALHEGDGVETSVDVGVVSDWGVVGPGMQECSYRTDEGRGEAGGLEVRDEVAEYSSAGEQLERAVKHSEGITEYSLAGEEPEGAVENSEGVTEYSPAGERPVGAVENSEGVAEYSPAGEQPEGAVENSEGVTEYSPAGEQPMGVLEHSEGGTEYSPAEEELEGAAEYSEVVAEYSPAREQPMGAVEHSDGGAEYSPAEGELEGTAKYSAEGITEYLPGGNQYERVPGLSERVSEHSLSGKVAEHSEGVAEYSPSGEVVAEHSEGYSSTHGQFHGVTDDPEGVDELELVTEGGISAGENRTGVSEHSAGGAEYSPSAEEFVKVSGSRGDAGAEHSEGGAEYSGQYVRGPRCEYFEGVAEYSVVVGGQGSEGAEYSVVGGQGSESAEYSVVGGQGSEGAGYSVCQDSGIAEYSPAGRKCERSEEYLAGGEDEGGMEYSTAGGQYEGSSEYSTAGGQYEGGTEYSTARGQDGGGSEYSTAGGQYEGCTEYLTAGGQYEEGPENLAAGGQDEGGTEYLTAGEQYYEDDVGKSGAVGKQDLDQDRDKVAGITEDTAETEGKSDDDDDDLYGECLVNEGVFQENPIPEVRSIVPLKPADQLPPPASQLDESVSQDGPIPAVGPIVPLKPVDQLPPPASRLDEGVSQDGPIPAARPIIPAAQPPPPASQLPSRLDIYSRRHGIKTMQKEAAMQYSPHPKSSGAPPPLSSVTSPEPLSVALQGAPSMASHPSVDPPRFPSVISLGTPLVVNSPDTPSSDPGLSIAEAASPPKSPPPPDALPPALASGTVASSVTPPHTPAPLMPPSSLVTPSVTPPVQALPQADESVKAVGDEAFYTAGSEGQYLQVDGVKYYVDESGYYYTTDGYVYQDGQYYKGQEYGYEGDQNQKYGGQEGDQNQQYGGQEGDQNQQYGGQEGDKNQLYRGQEVSQGEQYLSSDGQQYYIEGYSDQYYSEHQHYQYLPEQQQEYPTDQQQAGQQFPADQQQLPQAGQQFPPDQQQLPQAGQQAGQQYSPAQHQLQQAEQQYPPDEQQAIPAEQPPNQKHLPQPVQQNLPDQQQLLPQAIPQQLEYPASQLQLPQYLLDQQQQLPQPVPQAGQQLPPGQQHLPPAGQELPPGQQHLPQAEQELPPGQQHLQHAGQQLPPDQQHLPQTGQQLPPGQQHQPPTGQQLSQATPQADPPGQQNLPQYLPDQPQHLPQAGQPYPPNQLLPPQPIQQLPQAIPQAGQLLPPGQQHLPPAGQQLPQAIPQAGQLLPPGQQHLPPAGQPIPQAGQLLPPGQQHLPPAGQPIPQAGQQYPPGQQHISPVGQQLTPGQQHLPPAGQQLPQRVPQAAQQHPPNPQQPGQQYPPDQQQPQTVQQHPPGQQQAGQQYPSGQQQPSAVLETYSPYQDPQAKMYPQDPQTGAYAQDPHPSKTYPKDPNSRARPHPRDHLPYSQDQHPNDRSRGKRPYPQSERAYYDGDYQRYQQDYQSPSYMESRSSGSPVGLPAGRYRASYQDMDRWQDPEGGREERREWFRGAYDSGRALSRNQGSPSQQDPSYGSSDSDSLWNMRDPRNLREEATRSSKSRSGRMEEPKESRHYTKSAKYKLVSANFGQKSNVKQTDPKPKVGDKSRRGPQVVLPHTASESPPSKRKKVEKPIKLPSSFPGESSGVKKSLSSFKIPKRKTETKAAATASPTTPAVKIPALDITDGKQVEKEAKDVNLGMKQSDEPSESKEAVGGSYREAALNILKTLMTQRVAAPSNQGAQQTAALKSFDLRVEKAKQMLALVSKSVEPKVGKAKLVPTPVLTSIPPVLPTVVAETRTAASVPVKPASPKGTKTANKGGVVATKGKQTAPSTNKPSKYVLDPSLLQSLAVTIKQSMKQAELELEKTKKSATPPPPTYFSSASPAIRLPSILSQQSAVSLVIPSTSSQPSSLATPAAATLSTAQAKPAAKPISLAPTTTVRIQGTSSARQHSSGLVFATVLPTTAAKSHATLASVKVNTSATVPCQPLEKNCASKEGADSIAGRGAALPKEGVRCADPGRVSRDAGGQLTTAVPDISSLGGEKWKPLDKEVAITGEKGKDFPLVSMTGPLVSTTGPLVSTTGPLVSTTGPLVSTTGPLLSTTGPLVSMTGPLVSTTGPLVSTASTTGSGSKEDPTPSSDNLAPSPAYALPPGILPPDFDCEDQTSVFVDANYHVLYKEYNLRRSRTFLTAIKPGKEEQDTSTAVVADSEAVKNVPEKRERSEDDTADSTGGAKRLKTDEAAIVSIEKAEAASPVKTSPHKVGRGRKPSLSKSQRRKKQVRRVSGDGTGTEKLCCLCSRKDSTSKLGFLYGPYKPTSADNKDSSEGPANGGALGEGGESTVDTLPSASLWVHDECAVWAPGVCIARGKLLGLHESVQDGKTLTCRSCKAAGATLCCSARGCKAVYHYPCARDADCFFKEEQFLVACPRHKPSS